MTLKPQFTARPVIWWAGLRIRAAALPGHVARIRRTWLRVQPWLAGAALVFAWLWIQAWMAAQELQLKLREANAANVELDFENQRVQDELAEATATRTQSLVYLIEADSTREARDKLARLALMVATESFNLRKPTEKQ